MRSWLTPAVLFVLLNLVIGTIAITSKSLLAHIHPNDPAGDGENHGIARTASSALHRLRSLSLMRLRSGDFFLDPSISASVQHKSDEISDVSSETKVSEQRSTAEGEAESTMIKSASEPSEVRSIEGMMAVKTEKAVEEEVEDGVDARADDFINRFRQQLHLQRLDSLLKYKDMLSGGR